jgi:uncharacterized protein YbjT (DUF2867 family)
MPIGGKGLAMVDARDIAEVAAIELIRRDQARATAADRDHQSGRSDTLTGADVAAIWSEVLGPPDRLWRRRPRRASSRTWQPHAEMDGL